MVIAISSDGVRGNPHLAAPAALFAVQALAVSLFLGARGRSRRATGRRVGCGGKILLLVVWGIAWVDDGHQDDGRQ